MRNVCYVLGWLAGCATPAIERSNQASHSTSYVVLDQSQDRQLVGVIQQQMTDSDAPVVYDVFLSQGRQLLPLSIEAIDVVFEEKTGSIAWISPGGELRLSPEENPRSSQVIAQNVFYGLITQGGRIVYNLRIDGPESAVFLYDVRGQRSVVLEDGVGADEVLALSPDGSQALILSSRTGLSSLYRKHLKTDELTQMTNVGMKAGSFDPALVAPNPINKHEVVWGKGGIAYRSQQGTFLLTLDHRVKALPSNISLQEAAQ